jgi:hypothetical protein
MAEEANYYTNTTFKVLAYCEIRAEKVGTVADLHIQRRSLSIKEWRVEAYTLRVLVSCCYQMLETQSFGSDILSKWLAVFNWCCKILKQLLQG